MTSRFRNILISLTLFFIGSMFFFLKQGYVMINLPFLLSKGGVDTFHNRTASRKNINLFYFKGNKLSQENSSMIYKGDTTEDLKFLINLWLSLVYDEEIIDRKISIEDVSISHSGKEAYVSFDTAIVPSEWSIREKWRFIESLLKTVRQSPININYIIFLSRHKIIQDEHLDFSKPWPIDGFIS